MDGLVRVGFLTWDQFKVEWRHKLGDLRKHEVTHTILTDRLVFRGVGCKDYHLEASFDRFLRTSGAASREPFKVYRDAIMSYIRAGRTVSVLDTSYDVSPDDPNPLLRPQFLRAEQHAQHNGFPTRLLDWSRSPYMAAFFAAINSRSSKSGDISIWCLDTHETQNILNKDVQIVEPLDFANKRLLSQRGCFTRNETNRPHMDELFLANNQRFFRQPEFPFLVQFNLPASEAGAMIVDLMLMGIDFLSVYPDHEGMRESIKHEVLVRLIG